MIQIPGKLSGKLMKMSISVRMMRWVKVSLNGEKHLFYFKGASSQREPTSGIPYRWALGLLFLNTYMAIFGTDKWEHTDEPCFNALSLQSRIEAVFGKNWMSLRSRVICVR